MFELRFRGRQVHAATVEAGLFRLDPPEALEAPLEPDLLFGGDEGRLGLRPERGRETLIALPATGGLISNLRVWENIVLPRWYHAQKLDEGLEAETVAWVRRLLPYLADAEGWLHRTVGMLPADERCVAGLVRSLLAPAPWVFVDAAWAEALDPAQLRLCAQALAEAMRERSRVALVYSPQISLSATDLLWEPYVSPLTWTAA